MTKDSEEGKEEKRAGREPGKKEREEGRGPR